MSFIFFGIAALIRCVLSARKSRADYTLGTRTNKGRLKFGFYDENLFRRPFSVKGIKQTNVPQRGRF
ncbi:choline transporter [Neisseria macacae ATCC 33926]|uniref:Choline transporter n=1 Tax=Neisseria macacae ATCC 33926 TaxID=997348 RepID=A0AA36UJC1_9NEIS|nr:choline transporter [Neisseria macacae ATCC 33926]